MLDRQFLLPFLSSLHRDQYSEKQVPLVTIEKAGEDISMKRFLKNHYLYISIMIDPLHQRYPNSNISNATNTRQSM